MKLGIVLVCIAAGVLLVANASEREDDGHGSLVGGRQVLGRKLKSLMEDSLKQIAGSSPERKLLHDHSGNSGYSNSGHSNSGHSGHSSGYSGGNSGHSDSGHSGDHWGDGHSGDHSDKNYG